MHHRPLSSSFSASWRGCRFCLSSSACRAVPLLFAIRFWRSRREIICPWRRKFLAPLLLVAESWSFAARALAGLSPETLVSVEMKVNPVCRQSSVCATAVCRSVSFSGPPSGSRSTRTCFRPSSACLSLPAGAGSCCSPHRASWPGLVARPEWAGWRWS